MWFTVSWKTKSETLLYRLSPTQGLWEYHQRSSIRFLTLYPLMTRSGHENRTTSCRFWQICQLMMPVLISVPAEINESWSLVLWSVLLMKELSKLGNCTQTFSVRFHPMGNSYEWWDLWLQAYAHVFRILMGTGYSWVQDTHGYRIVGWVLKYHRTI